MSISKSLNLNLSHVQRSIISILYGLSGRDIVLQVGTGINNHGFAQDHDRRHVFRREQLHGEIYGLRRRKLDLELEVHFASHHHRGRVVVLSSLREGKR